MARAFGNRDLYSERPWRHDRIKPIYLFETTVRTWLVTTPRVLEKRFPSFNRTISLLFMYMMFQVLALLGAFLLNAICSVTLDISGLAARHAFDFSLNISIVHGFATFYVTYSTIRVFVRFGQAIGVIAWESLDDFPDARKIIGNATSAWPMFISIVFIPQCLMALSLVGTPLLCEGIPAPDPSWLNFNTMEEETLSAGIKQAFPFRLDWMSMLDAARQEGLIDRLRGFVCTRTPLLYFTRPYPSPRRTMSAVLVVGLVQYAQVLLHRFPNWQADMKASGKAGRLCVHFSLLGCLALTGGWLSGWVAMQLGLDLGGEWVKRTVGMELPLAAWNWAFGDMNVQESGVWLIMAWTLWMAVVAYVLCKNASSRPPKDAELRVFFQNLKTSFIVAVTFFFLRGCVSPTMGFIEAQQELTVLTIVIPILYVALYTTINAALQLSVGLVVVGGPAAMVMSVQLCRSSGLGGPGTFMLVFLHMFIKLIQLFGDDAFTDPERDGYDEGDARGRSMSIPLNLDDASDGGGRRRRRPTADSTSPNGDEVRDGGIAMMRTVKTEDSTLETIRNNHGNDTDDTNTNRGTKELFEVGEEKTNVEGKGDGQAARGRQGAGGDIPSVSPSLTPNPLELPRNQQNRDVSRAWSASPSSGNLARRHHRIAHALQRQDEPIALRTDGLAGERDYDGSCGLVSGGGGVGDAPSPSLTRSLVDSSGDGFKQQQRGAEERGDDGRDGVDRGFGNSSSSINSRRRETPLSCRNGKEGKRNFESGPTRTETLDSDDPRGNRRESAEALWDVGVAVDGVWPPPIQDRRRRLMKKRSNSMDDVLFASNRRRHDEWHNWDRRGTTRYERTTLELDAVASLEGPFRSQQRASDAAPANNNPEEKGRQDGRGEERFRSRPSWIGMKSVNQGVLSMRGFAAAMETTNAQFVFKGSIRGATALLAVLSLFLASCQIISLLQEEHEWYPSLIKYSVTESKQLVVDNAFIVRATLETTGDPVTVAPRYASCGSTWHGLSLLDYALLAELAYFDQHDPEVPLSEVAKQFFPNSGKNEPDFRIKVKEGDHHSHAQFFEAYSSKLNVSVVSIRGTDIGRISDLIEDIKIWVEPIVFKALSMVFPTIRIWPDSTTSAVIEWLHETLQLFGLHQQAHYYRPLLEYVRSIKDRDVVLTGHSLGGGLARIVGALEKATSICFSPPGIAQSYRKFSVGAGTLDRALLHEMSVSVIPEHDFVPMIDTQVGLIQMISCSTAGKALQLSCHMLEGTICDIVQHCGDHRGRFTDCKFEYNMAHLVPQLLNLLHGKMIWVMGVAALVVIIGALVVLPEFLM